MTLKKEYDYIVVGTGPGGSTVARELAREKQNILIVEYGPRLRETGFVKVAPKVFLDKAKKALRSDGNIWFGRARILGGSSYVAMGNAATPPKKILDEWGVDLSEELAWSRKELRVTPMPEEFMGEATKRINKAAASLGWDMKPTPKCVDFSKCKRCSLCMFGCPTGAKWSSLEFIDEAVENGADSLIETEVTQVLHENASVYGISAIHNGETLTIKGNHVILAAGGLGTPIILQNSGISDAGKGLAGDVFQTTYGSTDDVGMQGEIVLATYLEQLIEERELFPAPYMYIPFYVKRDMDGGQPMKMGMLQQVQMFLKAQTINTKRLIGMMTKIRDEMNGEVHNDGTISKHLTEKDKAKLAEAHEINKKILIAAGAKPDSVFTGVYESGHPCCTAAIGKIVNEHQETEIENLFVSDASVFPSPLGMPPILTIVALSKRLSNRLLSE
jgi:choline dehydrogenase-like flavoprotein